MLTPLWDFDEGDLAQALIRAAIEEDHVVFPDPDTGEYLLADDVPLQSELQALAEYQHLAETVENHDDEAESLADDDEDEVINEITVATPWQSYHKFGEATIDPFDASEPVKQPRTAHGLSDCAVGWGLYCIVHGVSRKQYAAHLQIFSLLGPVDKINRLPKSLDTLKRHVQESIPHIELRVVRNLPLNPKKLSSSRQVAAMATGESPTQDLFFLNLVDFLGRIQGSQLTGNMHYGMADLVDSPTEAWHSMQWAGSVRTTSGDFGFYPPPPVHGPDLSG